MNEQEIIKKFKEYFKVQEVVSKRVYNLYGDASIRFLDLRLLHSLIIIRECLKKPITINNWHIGGTLQQRGLRENISDIVKDLTSKNKLYLSAHMFGKAFDFDVQNMSAEDVRIWIGKNANILPYKVRLENRVTWVHLDVIYEEKNNKVTYFNP